MGDTQLPKNICILQKMSHILLHLWKKNLILMLLMGVGGEALTQNYKGKNHLYSEASSSEEETTSTSAFTREVLLQVYSEENKQKSSSFAEE